VVRFVDCVEEVERYYGNVHSTISIGVGKGAGLRPGITGAGYETVVEGEEP
jgi:hypothetical protein